MTQSVDDDVDASLLDLQNQLRCMVLAERITRGMRSEIGSKGWTIIAELDDSDAFGSRFYTAGLLENLGHPELMMRGEPNEVRCRAFATLVTFIRWGLPLPVGEPVVQIFEGPVVMTKMAAELAKEMAFASYANADVRRIPFELVEVTFPNGGERLRASVLLAHEKLI